MDYNVRMTGNREIIFKVLLFVLGMMMVVYGWRSVFRSLLDVRHHISLLILGALAFGSGLIILYLLILRRTKKDQ